MSAGPTYEVRLADRAAKSLRKHPKDVRAQINEKLLALETDPRPHGYKKLKGVEDLYRVRTGNFRIVYAIEDDKLIVYVVDVGDRKDVYGGL